MQKYLLLILGVVFYTCMPIKEKASDLAELKRQFILKKAAALDCISKDTSLYAAEQAMLHKLEFLFYHTIPSDSTILSIEEENRVDSLERHYFTDVISLIQQYPVLQSGKLELQDKKNKHVLAYTSYNENETLLTILNLDEDNRAFVADYDFAKLELLVGNYDIYFTPPSLKSLALRPFEARVYKLK